ncbi:acyl-CoA N-acyltransferase [Pisolithus marmoratus]|nr:acyl-CoA N-acyltransferase [Pisolithus marmoratus]
MAMASSMSAGELHHDVHFRFPVREVENDRVKLVPFVSSLHAELFIQGSVNHPELFRFHGPYDSMVAFVEELIEGFIIPEPGATLYVITDKTRSPPHSPSPSEVDFAGVIGYLNTDATHLKTEIGYITILPPFQRTHVTTNAVGLLMEYALNPPSLSGLGLRRVQWQANELNYRSVQAAERMGFKREGTFRWDRVLPSGKGKPGDSVQSRAGDPKSDCVGTHTAILGICWDDWENGGREEALRIMARQS